MRAALDALPTSLSNLYETFWQKSIQRDDGSVRRSETILAVMLRAQRSLRVSEIQFITSELLHDEPHQQTATATFIANNPLIQIDEQSKARFIHVSVKDFLLHKRLSESVDVEALDRLLISVLRIEETAKREVEWAIKTPEVEDNTDFDDNSSVRSWSSTVFSLSSSIASESTAPTEETLVEETIAEQYAKLFTDNSVTHPLIVDIVKTSGRSGFELFFSALLAQYSNELQAIARPGSEAHAAVAAGKQTDIIAYRTALMSGALESINLPPKPVSIEEDRGKDEVMNRFLAILDQRAGDPGPALLPSEGVEHHNEAGVEPCEGLEGVDTIATKAAKGLEVKDGSEDVYVNLQQVKVFLTTTEPFQKLIEKMHHKLMPPIVLPAVPEPEPPFDIGSRRRPKAWYESSKESLRALILNVVPGGEPPLEAGMKRVRWTCVRTPLPFSSF